MMRYRIFQLHDRDRPVYQIRQMEKEGGPGGMTGPSHESIGGEPTVIVGSDVTLPQKWIPPIAPWDVPLDPIAAGMAVIESQEREFGFLAATIADLRRANLELAHRVKPQMPEHGEIGRQAMVIRLRNMVEEAEGRLRWNERTSEWEQPPAPRITVNPYSNQPPMTPAALLNHFHRVKRTPKGWTVSCTGPNHRRGDRHPSLSIAEGHTLPWVFHCHSGGCDPKDIIAGAGLDWRTVQGS